MKYNFDTPELLELAQKEAPRYTSYPPVPLWNKDLNSDLWQNHLREWDKINLSPPSPIEVYIHIPFCQSLCYYCGCHKIITRSHDKSLEYVHALKKEWSLYHKILQNHPINALHLGGGTPTFLTPSQLNLLLEDFQKLTTSDFIGSIEIDPRTYTREHGQTLVNLGFKRFSLGVQDFAPHVQKLMGRIQSFEQTAQVVYDLRNKGIEQINFDLIYGLPGQTEKSLIEDTLKKVADLKPPTIAFYGLAYVPWKAKGQNLINPKDLPNAQEKMALFHRACQFFKEEGYHYLGLDHFARENSYLYQAHKQKNMKRSFMGHTDVKAPVLVGLGASSISETPYSFAQNEKDVNRYIELVNKNEIPIVSGHTHGPLDHLSRNLIMELMCKGEIIIPDKTELQNKDSDLAIFEKLELIVWNKTQRKITLTPLGRPFVRQIAKLFDHHLQTKEQTERFSSTI